MSTWLAVIWSVGVATCGLTIFLKALRLNSRVARSRRLPTSKLLRDIEGMAAKVGLKKAPKIFLIDGMTQPFVWGWIKGSIYLPVTFDGHGKSSEQHGILAHELAHVRRYDAAINFVQLVVQSLFFFHPLVWWANNRIRHEREKCCDETAIATLSLEPRRYGSSIVETLSSTSRSILSLPSMAISGPAKNVEERLRSIMSEGRKFHRHPSVLTILTSILIAVVVLPSAFRVTHRAIAESGETTQEPPDSTHGEDEFVDESVSVPMNNNAEPTEVNLPARGATNEAEQRVAVVMKNFTMQKIQQMEDLSEKMDIPIPEEFVVLSESVRKSAPWGDVAVQFRSVQNMSGQYKEGIEDSRIKTPLWSGPMQELAGTYEIVKNFSPQLLEKFAGLLLDDIPDGSIFFAGTDWGRFVSTAFRDGNGTPRIFILTQNALADNSYMEYIRAAFGEQIHLPSSKDVQNVFRSYVEQVRSGNRQTDGNMSVKDGKVTIEGTIGVFQISSMLAKQIFEENKDDHPFYVQESYQIEWMSPYLTPHGAIMKLNPEPIQLTADHIEKDRTFWRKLRNNLLQYPEVAKSVVSRNEYAQLRSAIAGIYQYHGHYAEAEAVYREAYELCDGNPKITGKLVEMFLLQDRYDEAVEILASYTTKYPVDLQMKQNFAKLTQTQSTDKDPN